MLCMLRMLMSALHAQLPQGHVAKPGVRRHALRAQRRYAYAPSLCPLITWALRTRDLGHLLSGDPGHLLSRDLGHLSQAISYRVA